MDKRLIVALIGITVGGIGFGLLTPVTVVLLEKSGARSWITGLAATLGYISVILFSWYAGRLIDKYDVKRILIAGFFIWILGSIGHVLWYNYYVLFPIRIITGIGGTFIFVSTEVIINNCSDETNRGKNIGLYAVLLSVGIAIGTMLIWTLEIADWFPFLLGSFIMSAALVIEMIFLGEVTPAVSIQKSEKLSIKKMKLISLITPAIYGIFEASIIVVIPLFGLRNNFSETEVSFLLASFVVGGIILLYFISGLSDSLSKYHLLLIISAIMGLFFFLPVFTKSIVLLSIIFFFLGGFVPSFYTIGLNYTVGAVEKKYIAQANGYFIMFYGIGTVFGPILGALLVDLNKDLAYWLFSALLCITFSLIFMHKNRIFRG